ncbi:acyltransferase family protein [Jejudonia soesokkakensis]|uniref:Acyltransferase family protein n=1 Tax=Jejudonia soesokkakensis TaxID=1323432 RepID=A0ABW2MPV9_9FLAO
MKERLEWIDQARGLSIFLVVYGHNFPTYEPYIYSFHVPLFFFIAGIFHPSEVRFKGIIKRGKTVLLPYFIWASLLFLFWFFVGRKYGKSATQDLSVIDNFIGIFYAQGGQKYMDWGIPMWFLPCFFVLFLVFSVVRKIKNQFLCNGIMLLCILIGFGWTRISEVHLPWSVDVALVALSFYLAGNLLKKWLNQLTKKKAAIAFVVFLGINILGFYLNTGKVDMYRSLYGNELLFFVSGLAGSIASVLFFKAVPIFKFLSYLGRHTIVILATHLRMLTAIKLVLVFIFGITVFEFTEIEKVLLSVLQLIMIVPIIWFVNKYIPILDGQIKKR